MVGQISSAMAEEGLNIIDMINKSRGELAYSLIDINAPASETLINKLTAIDGVLAVRQL
jgi:D-3-phosphoglycerate dehydrogenase